MKYEIELTECTLHDIVEEAWRAYLMRWHMYTEKAEKAHSDLFKEHWKEMAEYEWSKEEELHAILLNLEREGESK